MTMRRFAPWGIVLIIGAGAVGIVQQGTMIAEQTTNELSTVLLTEFLLREFTEITPGKGPYPAEFNFGGGSNATSVKMTRPFKMHRYEVAQNLYRAFRASDPSRWRGPRNSVEMVSFDDAKAFCVELTERLREEQLIASDEIVRLPTEVEWEYVCRAGTATAFSFGDLADRLGDYGWFTGNAKGNDPPGGAKKPNPWGFYDMHGYVWEWCVSKRVDEGIAGTKDRKAAVRGGAWTSTADECRSDSRKMIDRSTRRPDVGFRLVISKAGS